MNSFDRTRFFLGDLVRSLDDPVPVMEPIEFILMLYPCTLILDRILLSG